LKLNIGFKDVPLLVIVAGVELDTVVTVPKLIDDELPCIPCGILKFSIAFDDVPVLVIVAGVELDTVVTVPIAIVPAGPGAPVMD
jgi:hypothetical protein